MSGTLLAFDFGTKSIGVAVGQRITGTARPLPAIKAQDGTPDWNLIGSVGIAGEQTGIYPVASPGGWQLIGRTPLKLYDADREKPVLLEAGQYIKFAAVTEEEYKKIEKEVEDGTYKYVVYDKEV